MRFGCAKKDLFMIKIFSLVLFVSALIWTWYLFNSPTQMGTDIHAGIQSKLTLLIEDSVKAKRPSMSNFRLNKMFTELLDNNKVKAHFSYQFDDTLPKDDENPTEDVTTQNISGEAILIKGLSEDPNVQKWILQSVTTDSQALDFKEGTTIYSEEPAPTETK